MTLVYITGEMYLKKPTNKKYVNSDSTILIKYK
jgi:hypothetical protein